MAHLTGTLLGIPQYYIHSSRRGLGHARRAVSIEHARTNNRGATQESLSSQEIEYIDGDVEHDQASMDELLARNFKSVPVTILGDQAVIGFNPRELARLFDLSDDGDVADLPTMVAKY